MTTLQQESASHGEAHGEGEGHGLHATEALYIKIAVILAVVTGIEVALYYVDISDATNVVALLVLAAVKFALVALYFMHLKFDNRLLRRLFVGGIILAVAVYVAYLMTLGVFV